MPPRFLFLCVVYIVNERSKCEKAMPTDTVRRDAIVVQAQVGIIDFHELESGPACTLHRAFRAPCL